MVPFSHSLPAIEEAITTVILDYGRPLSGISATATLVHTFTSPPNLTRITSFRRDLKVSHRVGSATANSNSVTQREIQHPQNNSMSHKITSHEFPKVSSLTHKVLRNKHFFKSQTVIPCCFIRKWFSLSAVTHAPSSRMHSWSEFPPKMLGWLEGGKPGVWRVTPEWDRSTIFNAWVCRRRKLKHTPCCHCNPALVCCVYQ